MADGALDGGGIASGRPYRWSTSATSAASWGNLGLSNGLWGGAFLGAYEVATAEERPRMGKELSKGSGTHQRCSSPAVVVASGGAACSFNQDGKAAP